ncbi:MAG TPA: acyl-CoA carboxylase subunit epsilon [Pseudonocardiaceae bacterium]|nr:acyl-CoA carboxylase subunit epsilon [Pseudonocardiaceae bacterium]
MTDDRPVLRVVHGSPDDAELAALTAVVLAVANGSASVDEPAPPSRWADRAALMPPHVHPGPGAWRASGLPH